MPNYLESQDCQHWQAKKHHKILVAEWLLSGQSLTQAKFCELTHLGSRLAPRILNLRDDGYPIITGRIQLADGTSVADYYLPKWFLSDVADVGLDRALYVAKTTKQITTTAKESANV